MDNHERRPRQPNNPPHIQSRHQHHPSQGPSSMPYPHAYTAAPGPSAYPELPAGQQYQPGPTDYQPTAQPNQPALPQQPRGPQPQQQVGPSAQQSQAAGQYHPGMYQFQQPAAAQQPAPPAPYENVPQYAAGARQQPSAMAVLPDQFGVQGYYVNPAPPAESGQRGPTSNPNPQMASQQQVPQGYNHPSFMSSTASYGTDMSVDAGGAAPTAPQPYGQPTPYQSQHPQPNTAEFDALFAHYSDELRKCFSEVRDGRLHQAGQTLIHFSNWLLTNAENLGLARDDAPIAAERLKLWREFNISWLTTFQRQKELTIEMQGGQRQHVTLMDFNQMEDMAKELIRFCDNMEKHGLVDYEMGVWEEEIITIIIECLDLLETHSSSNRRR